MTALLYFIVAAVVGGLATRTWLLDRSDPARQAFLGLGWSIAVAYVSFSLSLLPGLDGLRIVYMSAGLCVPAFSLWSVDRVFSRDGAASGPMVRRLAVTTAITAPSLTALQILFFPAAPRSSVIEVIAGVFILLGFGLTVRRIHEAAEATPLEVDRLRLRVLITVAAAAMCTTFLEQAGRNIGPAVDVSGLSIAARVVALQGPVPPLSTLLTALSIYFIYQILVMYRLLDLYELAARLAALVVSGMLLVLVDGFTLLWVGTFTEYPFHTTFQMFLASVLFLAAYDPLKQVIEWWANRLLNQRGQQLSTSLNHLARELPSSVTAQGLAETLLSRLHASGRIPVASVYLWDRSLDAFACAGTRGKPQQRPLAAVAANPFSEGFSEGEPWYVSADVARRARHSEVWSEVDKLMTAMNASLVVPFLSQHDVVLGWVCLKDEDWSDGFTADEILRLREVADLCAVGLSNIEEFAALEETRRLAALGQMAAGLAHEIRNPLAGIKGAAQYLQHEDLPSDASEMLSVVIDETDRLNIVVSQFLDYARPVVLDLELEHVNAITTHVMNVLRAQGVPDGITVVEDLAGDLPEAMLDSPRLAQVFLNLVQNAVQAMPTGGTLTVSTRRRLNRARIPCLEVAVSDTGAGIDTVDVGKLFIPFYTTKAHGTGLGLAVCLRLVRLHGGELDVQSAPGEGATFIVRLPIPGMEREHTEEAPRPSEPQSRKTGA